MIFLQSLNNLLHSDGAPFIRRAITYSRAIPFTHIQHVSTNKYLLVLDRATTFHVLFVLEVSMAGKYHSNIINWPSYTYYRP